MPERSATRRGVLAAAGGALLAGCSELDSFADGSDERISTVRLPDVTDDGESEPVVVETVPVAIERDLLARRVQRTTDLLATLPMSFGPEDLPNGHVRERLVDAAETASSAVEDARTAGSRLTALESLRRARSEARYAAAGWAFAQGETTVADLRDERDEAVQEARSLRSDHAYLGTDPVEATVIHARIEQNLYHVVADSDPTSPVDSGELLPVAEWGEAAEEARGHVADSEYLSDRYTSSLPDDAGSLEGRLETAAETLVADLRDRRDDLPPEPTEGDRDLAWQLRYRMRDAAESSAEYASDSPGPASTVLDGVGGLTDFLAYDRIRGRLDDGEQFGVEEAADVHEARSTAVEAIRTALSESPRPVLARPVLADAAMQVVAADEELGRLRGNVRPGRLDDPIRRYVAATARARSVPEASRSALDALDV